MKTILIFLVALLSIPGTSLAGGEFVSYRVKDIIVNASEGVFFRTTEATSNPDGCVDGTWNHLNSASSYTREMYALLLTAQAQEQPITFYLSGCSDNGYPKVHYFYLEVLK